MIAIDTNILIYAHRKKTKEHEAAKRAIELAVQDARGWGISLPSIVEFMSIVTHPTASGRPSSVQEAREFLSVLQEQAAMQIWSPQEGFLSRLTQLAIDLDVNGVRFFDLQIALVAFENGATEIWSHDRNFLKLPGLKVRDPLGR